MYISYAEPRRKEKKHFASTECFMKRNHERSVTPLGLHIVVDEMFQELIQQNVFLAICTE